MPRSSASRTASASDLYMLQSYRVRATGHGQRATGSAAATARCAFVLMAAVFGCILRDQSQAPTLTVGASRGRTHPPLHLVRPGHDLASSAIPGTRTRCPVHASRARARAGAMLGETR